MNQKLDLTVVYYVRNEAEGIEKTTDEVVEVLNGMDLSYEVLAINVPADDSTYEVLKKLGDKYEHFYPIDMVQVKADHLQKGYQILLGCRLARGRKVIITDTDGQVDPQDYSKLLDKIDEGYDVVFGWRKDRKGKHGFFYNFTSWGQNIVTRWIGGVRVHDKNCGLKAFTDVAAKSLSLYGRNFRDMALQFSAKKFKISEVPISWRERSGGIQSFKFMDRLFGGTLDLLVSVLLSKMMDKPFRFWGMVAVIAEVLGVGLGVVAGIAMWLGWTGCTGWSADFLWVYVAAFALAFLICISGMLAFSIGMVTEFVVSDRKFDLDDYFIIDDHKNIVPAG